MARGRNRRTVDRDPAASRRRWRRGVGLALPALGLLAALGAAALFSWRVGVQGPALRLRAIRFQGLAQVTPEALLELSPVHVGDPLALADLAAMERALLRNPWVARASIERRLLPPALEVTVVERQAAALVDLDGLYLADGAGQVFKRAAPGDGLDLPVVTGIGREAWSERRDDAQAVLRAALALAGRWRELGLDRRAPISEIHVDPDTGVTVFAGKDGLEIRLGQGDLPAKLGRLGQVLAALAAEGRRGEIIHLDNRRHPDWVAVRIAGAKRGDAEGRSPVAVGPRGP